MTSDLPDDWSVPSFRGISKQIDMFGVPPEHLSLAIMLGSAPSLILVFVSTFGKSLTAFFCAVALAAIFIPVLFFILKALYKADNFWAEHLTTHKFPEERWMGQ